MQPPGPKRGPKQKTVPTSSKDDQEELRLGVGFGLVSGGIAASKCIGLELVLLFAAAADPELV